MKQLLTLDFGGTSVKYGIVTEDAQLSGTGEVPAPLESCEQFVQTVRSLYEQRKETVQGIALSMPGVLNGETGDLHSAGAYNSILAGKNVKELLKDMGVPVSVENDGKSAALAELWNGALKNVKNGAVIVIGTGLGGGVIMDGKLQRGPGLACGEISMLLSEAGHYDMMSLAGLTASATGLLMAVAAVKGISPAQMGVSPTLTDM